MRRDVELLAGRRTGEEKLEKRDEWKKKSRRVTEKEVIFAIHIEAEVLDEASVEWNFNTFITLCSECRVAGNRTRNNKNYLRK